MVISFRPLSGLSLFLHKQQITLEQYNMFPSPLGVISFFTWYDACEKIFVTGFPSPLGVISFFTNITATEKKLNTAFPSPLGVISFFTLLLISTE